MNMLRTFIITLMTAALIGCIGTGKLDTEVAEQQASVSGDCYDALDNSFSDVLDSISDGVRNAFSGDDNITDEAQILREMRIQSEAAFLTMENIVAYLNGQPARQSVTVEIINAMAAFCRSTNIYDRDIARSEARMAAVPGITKSLVWGLVSAYGIHSVSDALVSLGANKAINTTNNTSIGGDGAINDSSFSQPTTSTEAIDNSVDNQDSSDNSDNSGNSDNPNNSTTAESE